MKSILLKSLLLITIFLIQSCDDSFSPKGEFEEGYTLYCILDGNTSNQQAYLFKNFYPEGFDAESYDEDRTVAGAAVTIRDGGSSFTFSDTSEFIESLGYAVNYYSLNDYIPSSNVLTLSVQTPDGKYLSATTVIDIKEISFSASTRRELQFNEQDSLRVIFEQDTQFLFVPFLILNCRNISGGDTTYFQKEVPSDYRMENGNRVPIYPDFKLRNYYKYSIADIIYEIEKIAETKKPADQMKILNLTLGVLQVTNPLDIYFKTYKTNSDGFSIRAFEPNISNVSNADGIFAYKKITSTNILFRTDWNKFFSDHHLQQR